MQTFSYGAHIPPVAVQVPLVARSRHADDRACLGVGAERGMRLADNRTLGNGWMLRQTSPPCWEKDTKVLEYSLQTVLTEVNTVDE